MLLGAVFRADNQGLDPALFHAAALSGSGAALSPAARDVLTSDAILSYTHALAEGAIARQERPWTQALHPLPVDAVAAVDRAIAAPDPAAAITALAPASPEYAVLRRAYLYYHARATGTPAAQEKASYLGLAENDGGNYAGTAHSRRSAEHPYLSSEAAQRRARQLSVALERLRWLPRFMPRDRVVVNTATQQLQLFQDDRLVFSTRVVVGRPTKQTPELHATINDVLFNPPWNIPSSILHKEILPKLARDPDYFIWPRSCWMRARPRSHAASPKGGPMPGPCRSRSTSILSTRRSPLLPPARSNSMPIPISATPRCGSC
jgi:murein L,D-transpeptidase YcbB/YkuD